MPQMAIPDDVLAPGLREELITSALAERLAEIEERVEQRSVDGAEGLDLLRRHAADIVDEGLGAVSGVHSQAELVNALADQLAGRLNLVPPPSLLTGIRSSTSGLASAALPDRPQIPLTANEL